MRLCSFGFLLSPCQSWLGCWGVRVFLRPRPVPRRSCLGCAVWACGFACALRLCPASPGWRSWFVRLGSGFCFHPANPGRGAGVRVFVYAPRPYPRFTWVVCAVWVYVIWFGLRSRPAIPGWGVGVCVLVCASRLHPASPGLGCCFVCVGWGCGCHPANPGWGFCACVLVCALRLYPAFPGSGVRCGRVCLGSGFGCAPPFLAQVFGCVFGGVRSACTPPILAGLCIVGVCSWAQVSAAPCHSWLGCWGVCVCVCAPPLSCQSWLGYAVLVCVLGLGFPLRPAIPGSGVGLCLFVCELCLYPANPGWGVQCGCMCLGSGCGFTPPILAGVLGCLFWCVRSACTLLIPAGVCGVCVCVLGLGFRLRPAIPGAVFGCVCWCARSAITPQPLAGLCSVGVCVWAQVLAAPRHSWLGCRVV